MKLSFKDTQFILEAIDNLINTYEKNLESGSLDEDQTADLGNDCLFLTSLRHSLATKLSSDAETHLQNPSIPELANIVLQLPVDRRLALIDVITQSIRQDLQAAS